MIKTDKNYSSIKELRERERLEAEKSLREECDRIANERYSEDQMKRWSMEHKGLWYLPIMDIEGQRVEFLLVLKPINRVILSYASTKINDTGLYAFLEQCMRDCLITGDEIILDEDDFFIPAANKFNAILEGRKAAMLKR